MNKLGPTYSTLPPFLPCAKRFLRKILLQKIPNKTLSQFYDQSQKRKAAMDSKKVISLEGRRDDPLRFGIHGVKSDIIEPHPLESAYRSAKGGEEDMKRKILSNTYGAAFPMKMDMDRQILSRFQRPSGVIPSSFVGLEAFTGNLEDFGFEDYLNDPKESESFRPVDMHHGMEVHLGLSKGPVHPSFM